MIVASININQIYHFTIFKDGRNGYVKEFARYGLLHRRNKPAVYGKFSYYYLYGKEQIPSYYIVSKT